MAEKNSTTKTPESEWLDNLLDRALWPITNFVKELNAQSDYGTREELDRLLSFLVPIIDTVKENLDVLDHILGESLGHIEIEITSKLRLFGGYRRGDFGKAFIVPKGPQAAAQGGE